MAFNVTLEMTDKDIAKITLSGELDASVAPAFKTEIEKAATLAGQAGCFANAGVGVYGQRRLTGIGLCQAENGARG